MRKIAKGLVGRRKNRRLEEETRLKKEKEAEELRQCLIYRGIELVLQISEIYEEKKKTTSQGNPINEEMRNTKSAKRGK
jgi:hypothetical protein